MVKEARIRNSQGKVGYRPLGAIYKPESSVLSSQTHWLAPKTRKTGPKWAEAPEEPGPWWKQLYWEGAGQNPVFLTVKSVAPSGLTFGTIQDFLKKQQKRKLWLLRKGKKKKTWENEFLCIIMPFPNRKASLSLASCQKIWWRIKTISYQDPAKSRTSFSFSLPASLSTPLVDSHFSLKGLMLSPSGQNICAVFGFFTDHTSCKGQILQIWPTSSCSPNEGMNTWAISVKPSWHSHSQWLILENLGSLKRNRDSKCWYISSYNSKISQLSSEKF